MQSQNLNIEYNYKKKSTFMVTNAIRKPLFCKKGLQGWQGKKGLRKNIMIF